MPKINIWAVVVAAAVAFVQGALWYSPLLFGKAWMELSGIDPATANAVPPVWVLVAEFVRELVIAAVLAYFIVKAGVVDWTGGLKLACLVWIGFYAAIYTGAVIHEGMPLKLYVIHAGDGLVKILLMAAILGTWRGRRPVPASTE